MKFLVNKYGLTSGRICTNMNQNKQKVDRYLRIDQEEDNVYKFKRLLELLQKHENTVLATKTSWGRNDLKLALAKAKLDAMAEFMDFPL
jgi:hypothetical protein